MKISEMVSLFLLQCNIFLLLFFPTGAFDPLDPQGNITIKWDILEWQDQGYDALVSIHNYQLYRHIEEPGWRLGWEWAHKEVIWNVQGAEATEQGNCSRFTGKIPHCCEKKPVIVDLLPGAPYNRQSANCCRGGVLSSVVQNPTKSLAAFEISVGEVPDTIGNFTFPSNFTFGVLGYTCGPAEEATTPTKFPVDGGRRMTQALRTYRLTCTYSAIRAGPAPACCVSLSSFYNTTIVKCPYCSCGCQAPSTPPQCSEHGDMSAFLKLKPDVQTRVSPFVHCTDHRCPIRVHWHIKTSYKGQWRVKMTVTNFNMIKNYSDWNLVVQHPNLHNITRVFSFNYRPLDIYPSINDSAMFWGLPFYNDMLMQYGKDGNVQSEMLMGKDPGGFTFGAGWAFPRKIYFNGEPCVMPPPDQYPHLPNGCFRLASLDHLTKWCFLPLLMLVHTLLV